VVAVCVRWKSPPEDVLEPRGVFARGCAEEEQQWQATNLVVVVLVLLLLERVSRARWQSE